MYKTCHTEASSLRQRALELGLLDAMASQSYGKITLSDLCRRLEIPRKSFYRYFPTKDDCLLALVDHTLSECNTAVFSGWEGNARLGRADLALFFTYWQGQEPFLRAVRENRLDQLLLERTAALVDRIKENSHSPDFARDQVEYFIAHGLMATVLRWQRLGFPGTPGQLADTFAQVLGGSGIRIQGLML